MRNAQAQSTETESLEKRLRAYAAGAGAAAAGLAVHSPAAMAKVVVVPAHVIVGVHNSTFPINIDGTTEFTLSNHERSVYSSSLFVTPASGAGVVGHSPGNQVAALKFGAVIRSADQFEPGKQLLAFYSDPRFGSPFASGPFVNTRNRFLGLKFELDGQVYYGWAGFSVVNGATATLTAYAYETTPNTPIYAGQSSDSPRESRLLPANGSALNAAKLQPATLGVLALGSLGLDVWRKRESPETDVAEA